MRGKDSPQCHSSSGCLCCIILVLKDVPALPESSRAGPAALPSLRAGLFSVGTLGMTKFPSRIGKVPPAPSGSAPALGMGSGPCATAASPQQQVVLWDQPGLAKVAPPSCPLTTFPLHTQDTNPSAVPLFLGKKSNSNFLIAK